MFYHTCDGFNLNIMTTKFYHMQKTFVAVKFHFAEVIFLAGILTVRWPWSQR